jgi:chromosome segregation ATPase
MNPNGQLSYDQAVTALRSITDQIRRLEDELATAIEERANAEGAYRHTYAAKLRGHREAGTTVAEAEAYARADVAVLSRDRDRAEYRIRELLERLEDRRGERHSLHRLVDWSRGAPIRSES